MKNETSPTVDPSALGELVDEIHTRIDRGEHKVEISRIEISRVLNFHGREALVQGTIAVPVQLTGVAGDRLAITLASGALRGG